MLAGELAKAQDLLDHIELDKTNLQYSQFAIGLMRKHTVGRTIRPQQRWRKRSVEGIYRANIAAVVDAADSLRTASQTEAVIHSIARSNLRLPPEVQKSVLWLAYSLVLSGRLDEASPMIDAMEEPHPTDQQFSAQILPALAMPEKLRGALNLLPEVPFARRLPTHGLPEILFDRHLACARSEGICKPAVTSGPRPVLLYQTRGLNDQRLHTPAFPLLKSREKQFPNRFNVSRIDSSINEYTPTQACAHIMLLRRIRARHTIRL